jgi:hypothetical protein
MSDAEKGKAPLTRTKRFIVLPTSFQVYGSAYGEAARLLVAEMDVDGSLKNYPVVFLYRHAIETYIKGILCDFGGKIVKRSHNLQEQLVDLTKMGSTFRSTMPKFPTDDPDYRIIRRVPSRYLHYYFYIFDPVIGPLALCVGTYLPFQTTYYLNGHNFMEIELRRQGWRFAKTTMLSSRPQIRRRCKRLPTS